MKPFLALLASVMLAAAGATAHAQGTPSPAGQSVTPEGEKSADKAVAEKKAKRAAKRHARKARHAEKAASS